MEQFFMRTNRIGFSRWEEEDLPYGEFLWGSLLVCRYITKNQTFSQQEIRERIMREIQNQQQYGVQYYPIFELATGAFIGCCGLRPYGNEPKVYEMGFHLHESFWELGYGYEAGSAILTYAFDTLQAEKVMAGHHPENLASGGLLRKLGFVQIGEELYPPTGLMHPLYIRNRKE